METIKRLSSMLGITQEEAKTLLEQDGVKFLETIDPMTGTIEYMELDDE